MARVSSMEDLQAFLEQFRVQRGVPFTHITKTSPDLPAGTYYVSNVSITMLF